MVLVFVIIEVADGIITAVTHPVGFNLEQVLKMGQARWINYSGYDTMHEHRQTTPAELDFTEPGYDEKWGGVSRGFEMHWFDADHDIYVVEPAKALSPQMEKGGW